MTELLHRVIAGVEARGRSARRKSAPKHAPRVPFAVLVVGLIVGGMALLLALNTASAANELRRHDLAGKDATVGAQVQELQNEVAASAAPANLAGAAAALGMVPAANPAFLVIGADGSVRVLGSPAPVSLPPVVVQPPVHKKKAKKPASKSTKPARKSTKTGAHPSTSKPTHSPTPPAKKTPTPTPTPTLTLPGGNR